MTNFSDYGKIQSVPVSGRQGNYFMNSTSDYLLYLLIFNIFIIKEEINNEDKVLVITLFLYITVIFIYIKNVLLLLFSFLM